MDHPELSLGPSLSSFPESTNTSSSESEANNRKKRKLSSWMQPNTQTCIDLQLNNRLPLDWEQCLDLQSGRMYYLNRKTLKKSLLKPKEQKLDLDLNISNLPDCENNKNSSLSLENIEKQTSCSNGGSAMVAIVCLNCHLLVMLYRSSPSCPNCKYMHLLLPVPSPAPKKQSVKSLETLSLLH
ncbi:hypothetical protein IEQ34_010694 [Dendrobium chrysotoxum]|uniref:WW domain-containing protein n=1 Tax=Dendrobium chrysotoxum TaxID=161865 RepID=A0AAV7GTL7_DENCH|nr:hypothetical protein IEQ34_010694 [Dendrobium chrysotoxum]